MWTRVMGEREREKVGAKSQRRYQLHDNDFSKLSFVLALNSEFEWLVWHLAYAYMHWTTSRPFLYSMLPSTSPHTVRQELNIFIIIWKFFRTCFAFRLLWFIYLMPSSLYIRHEKFLWTSTQITVHSKQIENRKTKNEWNSNKTKTKRKQKANRNDEENERKGTEYTNNSKLSINIKWTTQKKCWTKDLYVFRGIQSDKNMEVFKK